MNTSSCSKSQNTKHKMQYIQMLKRTVITIVIKSCHIISYVKYHMTNMTYMQHLTRCRKLINRMSVKTNEHLRYKIRIIRFNGNRNGQNM